MFRRTAFFVLLISVITIAPAFPAQLPTGIVAVVSASGEEMDIFDRVNRERQRQGLSVLEWNDGAARVAREYSSRMARDRFFDHIDPDGSSVVERAERSHLRGWSMIGENLFVCSPYGAFAKLAITGWLRSPTHRQIMLGRDWTSTGIGIGRSRDGSIYLTQIFLED